MTECATKIEVIAEMANGHEGDLGLAKKITLCAARSGANAIKYQKFSPDELATPKYQYYELYQKLQMTDSCWSELISYAKDLELKVYFDIFGLDSLNTLETQPIDGYKIHAADVSNVPLLNKIAESEKKVLLSLGGSFRQETEEATRILCVNKRNDVVLMHGFQSYPTKLSDSFISRIPALRQHYDLEVGFAGHYDGGFPETVYALNIMAVAAGANHLEIHITDDRKRKRTDYFSALDPDGFAMVVKKIAELTPALGSTTFELGTAELSYRELHKKQVVASQMIPAGTKITYNHLNLLRVETDQQFGEVSMEKVVNKIASKDIDKHTVVGLGDLK